MVFFQPNGTEGNSLSIAENFQQTQQTHKKKRNAATRTKDRLDALLLLDAIDPTISDEEDSLYSTDSEYCEE